MSGNTPFTMTGHTIDSITYTVIAKASENAKDPLHAKIEKLILRDITGKGLT